MNAPIRLEIDMPDWPRLMREPLAAKYLGIGTSSLRESGIEPKRLGRRILYDRRDLDRWADALNGQPLDVPEREAESASVLSRVKDRLGHGAH